MRKYNVIVLVAILLWGCSDDNDMLNTFPRDLSIQGIEEQSRNMYEVNPDSSTTEISLTGHWWNDHSDSLSVVFMDDSLRANFLPPSIFYDVNITLESDSEIRFYGMNTLGESFDTIYTYFVQNDKLYLDVQPDTPYFYHAANEDYYYQPLIMYSNMASLHIDLALEELYLTQSEELRQTLINDPYFEVVPGDTLAINLYHLIYE